MKEISNSDKNILGSSKTPVEKSHTDVANKATIMVFSRAITILVQMASIMVLTRILTKDDFGLLTFVLLAYSTVITISQLGLPESIFYFFERVPEESRKSFALLTGKMLFLVGLGSSLILIILTILAPRLGYPVNGLFIPMIFLALLELPTIPMPNILIAIDRAKQAAWLNIIASIFQFTALILPAALGQPLKVIIYCLLGYGIVRFALSAFLFLINFKVTAGSLPKGIVREQFQYSVPLALAQILWGLNRQIDKYVVAAFFPMTVLAEYAVGAWEIPIIPTIAYSVASVMMPLFVSSHLKGDKAEILSLWFKSIKKVSLIVLPLTILLLIIAEDLIAVAFSENYMAAAIPFRIYTLILLHRVASYTSLLKAVGETKFITYSAIFMTAINLALNFPFIMMWGVAGPPTATLVANIFSWGYILLKIRTALGINLSEVFPFRIYLKTLMLAILSAIPVIVISLKTVTSHEFALAWKIIAYLLTFLLVATVMKILKKEDWQYFKQIIGFEQKH